MAGGAPAERAVGEAAPRATEHHQDACPDCRPTTHR
jgi:hypothetical protein